MRVNVYAEEMTDRIEIIEKEIDGHKFTALRFYLYLPVTLNAEPADVQIRGPFLHRAGDDDSAAVTFWGKKDLRTMLRKALDMLNAHYANHDADSPERHWDSNEHEADGATPSSEQAAPGSDPLTAGQLLNLLRRLNPEQLQLPVFAAYDGGCRTSIYDVQTITVRSTKPYILLTGD